MEYAAYAVQQWTSMVQMPIYSQAPALLVRPMPNDASNTGSFNYTMWFKRDQTAVSAVESLFARCYTTTPAAATGCTAAALNTWVEIVFTLDDDASWSIGAATNNDVTYTTTQAYNDGQWHFLSFSKINGATAPVAQIDGNVVQLCHFLNSHDDER